MNKLTMWISISVFSTVGAWIPTLWHAGLFSGWSILGTLFGGLFGIFAAVKLSQYM